MLKEINIRDFYMLATKRECSKYVIFLANQMNKTFRSLSFAPARGPAGMLYFQPIDILQNPTPEQQAERQSLCLFLSYFYVRIFQIYGSLALTLLDDANVFVKFKDGKGLTEEQAAMARRGTTRPYGTVGAPNPVPQWYDVFKPDTFEREGPIFPGRRGPTDKLFQPPSERVQMGYRREERRDYDRDYGQGYGRDYGRGYRGGAVVPENKLGKYLFLRNLLDGEEIEARVVDELSYKKKIGHRISGIKGTFKLGESTFLGDSSRVGSGSFFFEIPVGRGRTRFYEIVTEVVKRIKNYTLRFVGIRYQSLLEEALIAQRSGYGVTAPRLSRRYDIEEGRLRDFVGRVFGAENGELEIVSSGSSDFKIETRRGQESPIEFMKSLKEQFDLLLGFRRESDIRDITRGDSRIAGEIDPNLDIKYTLTYLQEKKPLAHCIARGLQLLGNKNPDGTFTPAVCSTKFLISKKDYEEKITDRTGVPDPGEKITASGGIQALSNLFFDTLIFKSNKLIRSNRAINDYIGFMQKMTQVFMDPGSGKKTETEASLASASKESDTKKEELLNNPEFVKLDSITDTQMAKLCEGLKLDPVHPKSPEGKVVLSQVAKLFGRQIQHAANCGNILRQLFTTVSINGIVSVRINKTVFIKGVLELNRINELARRLLIGYYSDCEALYRNGVKAIQLGEQLKEKLRSEEGRKLKEMGASAEASASASAIPPKRPFRGGVTRKRSRTP